MFVDANLYVTLPLLVVITCLLFRLVAPPADGLLRPANGSWDIGAFQFQ